MPPNRFDPRSVYQPLDVGTPNSPLPTWLTNDPYQSFNSMLSEQEKMQAADIVNQTNQLNLQQKKDDIEQQKQLEDIIKQAAASQDPNADVNIDDMLKKLQIGAALAGNSDKVLAVEKIKNGRKGNTGPIRESVREAIDNAISGKPFTIPEDASPIETRQIIGASNTYNASKSIGDRNNRFYDPEVVKGRELSNEHQQQVNTGTQILHMTAGQTQTLGDAEGFNDYITNVKEKYLPELEKDRGARFVDQLVDPNSTASRLQGELNLVAKKAARAVEKGVITNQDFETIANIVKMRPLETNATVEDKINRLQEFIATATKANLNAMKKGGFNTSGFDTKIPKASTSDEPQSREEAIKKLAAEKLQKKIQDAGWQ